jgi:hypothetical protein
MTNNAWQPMGIAPDGSLGGGWHILWHIAHLPVSPPFLAPLPAARALLWGSRGS